MKMVVFWNVAPCSLVDFGWRFTDDVGNKIVWNVVDIYQTRGCYISDSRAFKIQFTFLNYFCRIYFNIILSSIQFFYDASRYRPIIGNKNSYPENQLYLKPILLNELGFNKI
jgi:hypothetical protein